VQWAMPYILETMRFSKVGGTAGAARLIRAAAPSRNGNAEQAEHITETIEEIVRLENSDRIRMSLSDKLASRIAGFGGSMLYVWLHVGWFSIWIVVNLSQLVFAPFDPYPFGLLTMIVSLEAIFLSTFVLISQNRQAIAADRRAKVDLQVNMIAEREITKVMDMVAHIHEHLGLQTPSRDAELEEMQRPTHVGKLADAVDEAERQVDPEGERRPESAGDTEK
jgi:uncharacterized membrane protein